MRVHFKKCYSCFTVILKQYSPLKIDKEWAKPEKQKWLDANEPGLQLRLTIYIRNTMECLEHFKKLVIPFHFMSNAWEWD